MNVEKLECTNIVGIRDRRVRSVLLIWARDGFYEYRQADDRSENKKISVIFSPIFPLYPEQNSESFLRACLQTIYIT